MTQSDIGPNALPGTPIDQPAGATALPGTPMDEPAGATVMPGTPIGSPTDELTTPPTSVEESDDANTTSFPVAENEPGDSVYQSDNVNQSDVENVGLINTQWKPGSYSAQCGARRNHRIDSRK